MEPNTNINSIHILSEAVVVGGVALYFYKKISELESNIEDLKKQIVMQNNQIRYLIGTTTSSSINENNELKVMNENTTIYAIKQSQLHSQPSNVECKDGVCRLISKNESEKKVAISKISKQIEFDRENIDRDQTYKVNTFTNFSPNPIIKSVTPKPSISEIESSNSSSLEKILNEIDNE